MLAGEAIVFDSESELFGWDDWAWREIIRPGALDDVFARAGRDLRALFDHKSQYVLGRESAGTLRLSLDGRALSYEIDPPNWAGWIVEGVERRELTGASFSMVVAEDRWTFRKGEPDLREVLRIEEIDEVSIVAWPAYTGTSASTRSMRDRAEAEAEASRRRARDRQRREGEAALRLRLAGFDLS